MSSPGRDVFWLLSLGFINDLCKSFPLVTMPLTAEQFVTVRWTAGQIKSPCWFCVSERRAGSGPPGVLVWSVDQREASAAGTPRAGVMMNFYGSGFQEKRFNQLKNVQQRWSEVLSTASKTALQSHSITLWKSCINLSWHSNYSKLERLPEYLRPDWLKQVQNWTDELSAWVKNPQRMKTQTSS